MPAGGASARVSHRGHVSRGVEGAWAACPVSVAVQQVSCYSDAGSWPCLWPSFHVCWPRHGHGASGFLQGWHRQLAPGGCAGVDCRTRGRHSGRGAGLMPPHSSELSVPLRFVLNPTGARLRSLLGSSLELRMSQLSVETLRRGLKLPAVPAQAL